MDPYSRPHNVRAEHASTACFSILYQPAATNVAKNAILQPFSVKAKTIETLANVASFISSHNVTIRCVDSDVQTAPILFHEVPELVLNLMIGHCRWPHYHQSWLSRIRTPSVDICQPSVRVDVQALLHSCTKGAQSLDTSV